MKVKTARYWMLALALAGMGGAGSAQAVLISYTEGVDLSDNSNIPTPLGALDAGVNTVTGTIACDDPAGSCSDPDFSDAFGTTLPAGLRITSVTLNVTGFGAVNGRGRALEFTAFPVNFAQSFTASGLLNLFSGAADGPGDLVFRTHADTIDFSSSSTVLYDYVWSITVERIPSAETPEPGTLALLGVALAGLGWSRRRRQ